MIQEADHVVYGEIWLRLLATARLRAGQRAARIIGWGALDHFAAPSLGGGATLLDHVSELVREQTSAFSGGWREAPSLESNVIPDSVSLGCHASGGLRCFRICVNSHAAEVISEARLEKRTS
jgi:hypothetical protein